MELGKRYECYQPYNYHYGAHYYVDPWPKSSPVSLGTREKLDLVLLRKLPGNDEMDVEPGTKGKPLCFSLNVSAVLLDDEKVNDWAEPLQEFYKNTDETPLKGNTVLDVLIKGETDGGTMGNTPLTDASPGSPGTNVEVHREWKSLAIRGCTSAKLTYLANQLHLYSPYEKSVVYVNSKADMKEVPAFLSTIGVKCVTWSPSDGPYFSYSQPYTLGDFVDEINDIKVVKFTTNDDCRVLVMPTWMAFSEVDLTVASRVYFFSLMWYDLIEAQAIQRVHRTGQTRAVHVETLVLRNTLEDTAYSFKGKPFYDSDCKTRMLRAMEDDVIFSIGKFLTPSWEDTVTVDGHSDEDGDRLFDQELSPVNRVEDIKGITDGASSAQSNSSDINRHPRPEHFFDEPIPLLSLLR